MNILSKSTALFLAPSSKMAASSSQFETVEPPMFVETKTSAVVEELQAKTIPVFNLPANFVWPTETETSEGAAGSGPTNQLSFHRGHDRKRNPGRKKRSQFFRAARKMKTAAHYGGFIA